MDPKQIEAATTELLGEHGENPEPEPTKSNVVMCRLDDADLDALDTLIEAGVRTTRSDSAAWLIRAGINANAELFAAIRDKVEHIRQTQESAKALAEQLLAGPERESGQ